MRKFGNPTTQQRKKDVEFCSMKAAQTVNRDGSLIMFEFFETILCIRKIIPKVQTERFFTASQKNVRLTGDSVKRAELTNN